MTQHQRGTEEVLPTPIRELADPEAPTGPRGGRPVRFTAGYDVWDQVRVVPGLRRTSSGFAASYDAALAVGRILGIPLEQIPQPRPLQLEEARAWPGLADFRRLGMGAVARPYQVEAIQHISRWRWGLLADPMRSGKSFVAIASSVIRQHRTLIVCPAIAKWVWADEIARWTGESAAILEGRSATEVRIFCATCRGRGLVCSGCAGRTPLCPVCRGAGGGDARCPTCRARNGTSYGSIRYSKDVAAVLGQHRWVIANYDIIAPQQGRDAAGKGILAEGFPGWLQVLAQQKFDRMYLDEAHLLRGRATGYVRKQNRQDYIRTLADPIPTVIAITGTPIFSRIAHLYPLLDITSNGLFGRPFFDFDIRFCDARKGARGWENSGRTNEEELRLRLKTFMIKRPRSVILAHMPRKQRSVIRIDPSEAEVKAARVVVHETSDYEGALAKSLAASFRLKVATIIEHVVAELLESPLLPEIDAETPARKLIVYVVLRENVEHFVKDLHAALGSKAHAARMREIGVKVWAVSGETDVQQRFQMAAAFRAHVGAGVFIASMGAVPGAISLRGAQTVHFAELSYSPTTMLQVEDRPYEPGTTGLSIVYYVARRTADDAVESAVLPKMDLLDRMVAEEGAREFSAAFEREQAKETIASIWAQLTAHLDPT